MPTRRSLLGSFAALLAAPAVIRTPGLLMPVRPALPGSVDLVNAADECTPVPMALFQIQKRGPSLYELAWLDMQQRHNEAILRVVGIAVEKRVGGLLRVGSRQQASVGMPTRADMPTRVS